MADYTNYLRDAIFSIEQTLSRDWNFIWTAGHPLLRILNYKGNNFNKGFGISGTRMPSWRRAATDAATGEE